jgi:hypothetical protein
MDEDFQTWAYTNSMVDYVDNKKESGGLIDSSTSDTKDYSNLSEEELAKRIKEDQENLKKIMEEKRRREAIEQEVIRQARLE